MNRTFHGMAGGRIALSVLLLVVLILPGGCASSMIEQPSAIHIEKIRRQPYHTYRTVDSLGREITFFLSEEPPSARPLPLVLYVQGSGCSSHFVRQDDSIRGATGHNAIADACRDKARLILVEKPGVEYLDDPADPGGATDARKEFREEHTLDRWVTACATAIRAARELPVVDPSKTLIIGHSEGGIIAAALAARLDCVTHLALLSAGGPTQLYDIIELARQGVYFTQASDDPQSRVQYVQNSWDRILADPNSPDRMFFGHPYRRWSSFLTHSTIEFARQSDAKVFIAQGESDTGHTRASFEMLCAELLVHDREVVQVLVPQADHSFVVAGPSPRDEWGPLQQQIIDWFASN